jgi:DNA-binding GntR family transcriptional regulator
VPGLPSRLSLNSLAAAYGVSPMPVRAAVSELIAEGLLRKSPNGRLEITPPAGPATTPAAATEEPALTPAPIAPLRFDAPGDREAEIAADVLRMGLSGGEVFLREEAASARWGLGRTTVRLLLSRLAGRGLLEHLHRRGWRVRPYSEADMRAYLDVRETLELKALDLARPRLVPADLERMHAGNCPDAPGGRQRLDNDLHRYIVDKADNRYIRDFFDRHGPYHSALFDYAAVGAAVVAEMAGQHRRILRALIDRDWPAARRALSEHIRAQEPVLSRMLARMRQRPGGGE